MNQSETIGTNQSNKLNLFVRSIIASSSNPLSDFVHLSNFELFFFVKQTNKQASESGKRETQRQRWTKRKS